jgi:proline iminopeptidase
MLAAYHHRFHHGAEAEKQRCAKAWSQWEGAVLSLLPDPQRVNNFGEDRFALAFARIESHYFINKGFMPHDGALLDGIEKIGHIPTIIVQGRYDVCTPPRSAFELKAKWPSAILHIVPDAGHSAIEPGITDRLVAATADFANQ